MTSTVPDHPIDPARVARVRASLPAVDTAAAIAAQLTLVADATRLRVMLALRKVDELCVGDLAMSLEVSDDAIGYALRMLRTAGLVAFRKEGRVVFYRLADGFPEALLDHCVLRLAGLAPGAGDNESS